MRSQAVAAAALLALLALGAAATATAERVTPAELSRIERISARLSRIHAALGARAQHLQDSIARVTALTHEFVSEKASAEHEQASLSHVADKAKVQEEALRQHHSTILEHQNELFQLQTETQQIQLALAQILDPAHAREPLVAAAAPVVAAASSSAPAISVDSNDSAAASVQAPLGEDSESSESGSADSAVQAPLGQEGFLVEGFFQLAGTTKSAQSGHVHIAPKFLVHLQSGGALEGRALVTRPKKAPVVSTLTGRWAPGGLHFEFDFESKHFAFHGHTLQAHSIEGDYVFGAHHKHGSFRLVALKITEKRFLFEEKPVSVKPIVALGQPCGDHDVCDKHLFCSSNSTCFAAGECSTDMDCNNNLNAWSHEKCQGTGMCNVLVGKCQWTCVEAVLKPTAVEQESSSQIAEAQSSASVQVPIKTALSESSSGHSSSSSGSASASAAGSSSAAESSSDLDEDTVDGLRQHFHDILQRPTEEVEVGRYFRPGLYAIKEGTVKDATGAEHPTPAIVMELLDGGDMHGIVEHLSTESSSSESSSLLQIVKGEWEPNNLQFHEFLHGRLYVFTSVLLSNGVVRGSFHSSSAKESLGFSDEASEASGSESSAHQGRFEWHVVRLEVKQASEQSEESSEAESSVFDSATQHHSAESSSANQFSSRDCPGVCEKKVEYGTPEIMETEVAPELRDDLGEIDHEPDSSSSKAMRFRQVQAIHQKLQTKAPPVDQILINAQMAFDGAEELTSKYLPKPVQQGVDVIKEIEDAEFKSIMH